MTECKLKHTYFYTRKSLLIEILIEKDKSVTIHNLNLRALVIEIYKIHHKISPDFIIELVMED